MSKPKVLLLLPKPLYNIIITKKAEEVLYSFAEVIRNERDDNLSSDEVAELLPGINGCLTGWGSARFDSSLLDKADSLKIISHTAGSIKFLIPEEVFDRGIIVTHAAGAIAPAVAELALLVTLLGLRRILPYDPALKAGEEWTKLRTELGEELFDKKVGVIGAGYTGREYIKLLKPFRAEVFVYDPYLSEERAKELGVKLASLNEIMATCKVVSLHAPSTEETHNMIGAEQLALLQEGAVFINTARAWVVDQDALLRELQKGRFWAALDVFEVEPLPVDSPFRKLPNVYLTPHLAGATIEARRRMGEVSVEDMRRFFAGEEPRYRVTKDMLRIMA